MLNTTTLNCDLFDTTVSKTKQNELLLNTNNHDYAHFAKLQTSTAGPIIICNARKQGRFQSSQITKMAKV